MTWRRPYASPWSAPGSMGSLPRPGHRPVRARRPGRASSTRERRRSAAVADRFGAAWRPSSRRSRGRRRGGRGCRRPRRTTTWRCRCSRPGMPMLVEKPVSDDLATEPEALVARPSAGSCRSCAASLERFNPAILTVRADDRATGPRHAPCATRPTRRGSAPAWRWDLLVHDVDVALRLIGDEPSSVRAGLGYFHPASVERRRGHGRGRHDLRRRCGGLGVGEPDRAAEDPYDRAITEIDRAHRGGPAAPRRDHLPARRARLAPPRTGWGTASRPSSRSRSWSARASRWRPSSTGSSTSSRARSTPMPSVTRSCPRTASSVLWWPRRPPRADRGRPDGAETTEGRGTGWCPAPLSSVCRDRPRATPAGGR